MKNLNLLVIFAFTFLMAEPIVNDETGWSYEQSTALGYYIFEEIQIDGLSADTSDVIGAFYNDVCVGWARVESDFTTLPTLGDDGSFPDYLSDGETPTLKIYDATYGTILDLEISNITVDTNDPPDGTPDLFGELPGWQINFTFYIGGATFTNNPIINTQTGW